MQQAGESTEDSRVQWIGVTPHQEKSPHLAPPVPRREVVGALRYVHNIIDQHCTVSQLHSRFNSALISQHSTLSLLACMVLLATDMDAKESTLYRVPDLR